MEINDKNVLVISDLHLTPKFNPKKLNFFMNLFRQADQVIILGDFWDNWFSSFKDFIESPWSAMFRLLDSKNTIYIFGNHDHHQAYDHDIDQFSEYAVKKISLNINGKKFNFIHGHQLLRKNPFLCRYAHLLKKKRPILRHILHFSELSLDYLFPELYTHNLLSRKVNQLMEKQIPKFFNNGITVCGHSHNPKLDLANNFINTGSMRFNIVNYLWINKNGQISLKSTNLKSLH